MSKYFVIYNTYLSGVISCISTVPDTSAKCASAYGYYWDAGNSDACDGGTHVLTAELLQS